VNKNFNLGRYRRTSNDPTEESLPARRREGIGPEIHLDIGEVDASNELKKRTPPDVGAAEPNSASAMPMNSVKVLPTNHCVRCLV
jgi:hypothetical protein